MDSNHSKFVNDRVLVWRPGARMGLRTVYFADKAVVLDRDVLRGVLAGDWSVDNLLAL